TTALSLSGAVAIAPGMSSTCALLAIGRMECWGSNHSGQLGDGTNIPHITPAVVAGLANVRQMALGRTEVACAAFDGQLSCWGSNVFGVVGDGTGMDRYSPVGLAIPGRPVAQVSVGYTLACALTVAGTPYCWGENNVGQLGDGTTIDHTTPAQAVVPGLPIAATHVSGGLWHTCKVVSDGGIRCWGNNTWGQLGSVSPADSTSPVDV